MWIQIFIDMATRFTHFEVMQGNTLADVTAAIFRFSSLFQRPQHIISDAGSSANLNPKSLCYQQYFGSAQIQTTKVAASHQFLNLAESQVASTKRLLRSIFYQREKLNLSTLTHSELETVLLGTAALLNSRPIFRTKNAFLSPNKLTQPWLAVDPNNREILVSTLSPNLEVLRKAIGGAHKTFIEIIRDLFLADKFRWHQSKHKYDFLEGDLVLCLKIDSYKLGIIQKINSPSYALVKFSGNQNFPGTPIHFSKMVLIHREVNPSIPASTSDRIVDSQATVSNFITLIL